MEIRKALTYGLEVLKKNPKIFLPAFIIAVLSTYVQVIPVPKESELINWFFLFLPITILFGLIGLFLSGMIIRMSYDATRRRVSISEAAKLVLRRYIRLLVSSIVVGIVVVAGLVALIIPGIFLTIQLFFYDYAILIDDNSVVDSLKKSWKIVKGKWWNVFALALILSLFSAVLVFVAGISALVSPIVSLAIYFLVILFMTPWYLSAFTFAYLQLRGKTKS